MDRKRSLSFSWASGGKGCGAFLSDVVPCESAWNALDGGGGGGMGFAWGSVADFDAMERLEDAVVVVDIDDVLLTAAGFQYESENGSIWA